MFLRIPLLLLSLFVSSCAPSVYTDPYPVREVVLPKDNAAHRAPIEWWYYTGHFEDEDAHAYGFELTFFKAYAPPSLRLFGLLPADLVIDKGHIAHFAITDITGQKFAMAERTDFWAYQARSSTESLDVSVAGWDWFSLQFIDDTELMLYLIR